MLQYEMRKLKERDERKRTLDTMIYPVVRIVTKAPLRPRCWSTHEDYRFRQSSLFREHNHGHNPAIKKFINWRRVGVIITYITIHIFGHKASVGWWSHAGGEFLIWFITWTCTWFFTTAYPFTKYGIWFMFGILLLLLLVLLELLLNVHKLMVRPDEDIPPNDTPMPTTQ